MSYTMGYGIYTTNKEMIKSCENYNDAIKFIKTLKNKNKIKVQYLFQKPKEIKVTKILYIQKFTETGGGIEHYGTKYYYNKEK